MAQNNEFLQAALERLKKEAGAVSRQKEKAMAGARRGLAALLDGMLDQIGAADG